MVSPIESRLILVVLMDNCQEKKSEINSGISDVMMGSYTQVRTPSTFLNGITNWGQSIQKPEFIAGISHSNCHKVLLKLSKWNFAFENTEFIKFQGAELLCAHPNQEHKIFHSSLSDHLCSLQEITEIHTSFIFCVIVEIAFSHWPRLP